MLKRYQSSFTHLTARISNLALVKSENRLVLKVILQVFFNVFAESPYYPADHTGTDCSG